MLVLLEPIKHIAVAYMYVPLCLVRIVLIIDLLDADLHSIF